MRGILGIGDPESVQRLREGRERRIEPMEHGSRLSIGAVTATDACLGTWTGDWPGDATTELRLERIDGAHVHATYGARRGADFHAFDLCPDSPTPATLVGAQVKFQMRSKPKNSRWTFTPTGDGRLGFIFKNRNGKTNRLALERGEPACLRRVESLAST